MRRAVFVNTKHTFPIGNLTGRKEAPLLKATSVNDIYRMFSSVKSLDICCPVEGRVLQGACGEQEYDNGEGGRERSESMGMWGEETKRFSKMVKSCSFMKKSPK